MSEASAKKSSSARRSHYVLSTHWDREWYQPLQDYRYRLVQLLDRVIEGLRTGVLRGPFQTDGQAIILDDYLEVRPERRELVMSLAKEGKFKIGPWYVLPDEFLVSGESIIRNVRMGRAIARSYGGIPSNAAFVCDLFGHNSQIPQIFAGFGIRGGFIWRGDNHITHRNVLWRGADGTEMPCYRFGIRGYTTYAFAVRKATEPLLAFDAAKADADLAAHIKEESQITDVDPILLFDGGDHLEWDPHSYSVLAHHIESGNSLNIVHSTLDDYLAEMLPQADRIKTVVTGELREPGKYPVHQDEQWLIPGVLSSRVTIKQANAQCQNLLCQWAEPSSLLATLLLKREYPQGFLDVAWKWLLQNHPHDSICGCSVDQIHQDMVYRFSQCRQIAERLTTESSLAIGKAVAGDVGDGQLRVVVQNPLPYELSDVVEINLEIPENWPQFNEFFGFEPKLAFRIYDAAGNELHYQRLAQAMSRQKFRTWPRHFPTAYKTHDVRVAVALKIPAGGYTTLTVKAGEKNVATRYGTSQGLATSERSMANEFLDVTIEPNGSVTLKDKTTGQSYSRLLTFEDIADIGDGWYHGQAVNDEMYTSTASAATVACVHNGPLMTSFRIRTVMNVPAEFEFDGMRRSGNLVPLAIESTITLRRGARRVEVRTSVDNVAKDHRLRVLFPTGANATTYLADSVFDVVERPIALRTDNDVYRELEVETKPQQMWTSVFDSTRGLAVISTGLMESAVRDLPERPIALTLFRGTRRTVFTSGQPDGQLNEHLEFNYWITPAGQPDIAMFFSLGQQLSGTVRTSQICPEDMQNERPAIRLAPEAASFGVSPSLVVTSLRDVGGAVEIRLFNPATTPAQGVITLPQIPGVKFTSYQPVDFESNPRGPATPCGGTSISINLKPKEIATFSLSYTA